MKEQIGNHNYKKKTVTVKSSMILTVSVNKTLREKNATEKCSITYYPIPSCDNMNLFIFKI